MRGEEVRAKRAQGAKGGQKHCDVKKNGHYLSKLMGSKAAESRRWTSRGGWGAVEEGVGWIREGRGIREGGKIGRRTREKGEAGGD